MSRYAYHDLHDRDFEQLVVWICNFLLGSATSQFTPGVDGGRDAKFHGTAADFPNGKSPAGGRFIIQAKHTTDPIAKCSDPEFSGDTDTSILSKEIPKIRRLREQGEVDHYLLFTNRRVSGNVDARICERIRTETGIPEPHLSGIENIDRFIKVYSRVPELANLRELDGPLRCTPDDLAQVIVHIAALADDGARPRSTATLERTRFARKNEVNGLSPDLAALITRSYMPDFLFIRQFLASGDNDQVRRFYENAADEFAAKLIAHRTDASFDKLLTQLIERLIERDPDLKRNTRLTRTVVYYMYFNCDIGTPLEGEGTC